MPHENPAQEKIFDILKTSKTIAVIGMSKNPEKDANSIPAYLIQKGYNVIPVNPSADEILGRKSYKKLSDIPGEIDIVDVFRPSEDVPNYVDEVIAKKPKVFWLQLGIRNDQAGAKVAEKGIIAIQDLCIMQEHKKLERIERSH
jgi:predicted CoA-binding protein